MLNLIADDHVDTDLIMLGFQNLFYTASGVKQTVASGLASQLVGPGAAIEVHYMFYTETQSLSCSSCDKITFHFN